MKLLRRFTPLVRIRRESGGEEEMVVEWRCAVRVVGVIELCLCV